MIRITEKGKVKLCLDPDVQDMSQEDSFVLDAGETLFIWHGDNTNRVKKAKALEMATNLNSENNSGRGKVRIVGENKVEDKHFWDIIGSESGISKKAEYDEDEESIWLYKIAYENNEVKVVPVETEGQLKRSMLEAESAFILDCDTQIFVWVGKKAGITERKSAAVFAEELIGMFERPAYTPITRVLQDNEPVLFREQFVDMFQKQVLAAHDKMMVNVATKMATSGTPVQTIEIKKMFNFSPPPKEEDPVQNMEEGSDVVDVRNLECIHAYAVTTGLASRE